MNVLQHTRNELNLCLKENRPDRSYRDTLLIIKNSKQVKFRVFFCGWQWPLKLIHINSHKSCWAQIHCKHLNSPLLSSKQGFNWCKLNRAKFTWCQFLVFFTPREARPFFITLFIYLFCGVQKDISRKNTTTFLKPPYGTSGRNGRFYARDVKVV